MYPWGLYSTPVPAQQSTDEFVTWVEQVRWMRYPRIVRAWINEFLEVWYLFGPIERVLVLSLVFVTFPFWMFKPFFNKKPYHMKAPKDFWRSTEYEKTY